MYTEYSANFYIQVAFILSYIGISSRRLTSLSSTKYKIIQCNIVTEIRETCEKERYKLKDNITSLQKKTKISNKNEYGISHSKNIDYMDSDIFQTVNVIQSTNNVSFCDVQFSYILSYFLILFVTFLSSVLQHNQKGAALTD